MIAEVTGAAEVLKKPKRRLLDDQGEGVNIFEILQLFRDSHAHRQGGDGGSRIAGDPIQQLLLAAAQADDHDNDFSDGDDPSGMESDPFGDGRFVIEE